MEVSQSALNASTERTNAERRWTQTGRVQKEGGHRKDECRKKMDTDRTSAERRWTQKGRVQKEDGHRQDECRKKTDSRKREY